MDNIFTGVSATTTKPDNNDFPIDDLLDFSSADDDDDYSPPSSTTTASGFFPHLPPLPSSAITSLLFTDYDLLLPNDDVAQLEWLSQFVEDSFTDSPANSLHAALDKSSHQITYSGGATSASASGGRPRQRKEKRRAAAEEGRGVRRCRHCASEKTPQWRTGPLGPKTLCNACGVRFKSGRLVPEYRPAASPTFVLTQHSNSHRKVLELRKQKEMVRQQQQQQRKFVVC